MIEQDPVWDEATKAERVFCPFCDKEHFTNVLEHKALHSFYGDQVTELKCRECQSTFYVKENVTRTFESWKTLIKI
ncbi:hypothetical protein, partial [Klebsiella pneumoniae]|uniref:hypothetical protein n=1 Tax=Klebsiella pneumoniae TaxID=573 RepID=UPI0038549BF6